MSNSVTRVGINAHLASTSATYRAAGTSRYLMGLLTELRRIDAPERIVAYMSRLHAPGTLAATSRFALRLSPLPTWRPAVRILWEQFLWPGLLLRDGIDVVHGPAHALPLGWPGRSVVTIHDLSFLVDPTTFHLANHRYLQTIVRLSVRRATRIIAVSESTRRDIIRYLGAAPERIDVIHEGVSAEFHPRAPDELAAFRAKHGLMDAFILFLGTIEPRKNLPRLLEAYAELRRRGRVELPLVIAGGEGPGAAATFLRCESLGLQGSVRFVGFVPEEDKPLWYNSAHVFVFPSQYEGFGLPVLEAFACGTPVVASDRSSLPEVVGDAGLLVDPFDTTALAEAMTQVIEDANLRHRLIAAGQEQAARFSWTAAAEKTLDVYRAVHAER